MIAIVSHRNARHAVLQGIVSGFLILWVSFILCCDVHVNCAGTGCHRLYDGGTYLPLLQRSSALPVWLWSFIFHIPIFGLVSDAEGHHTRSKCHCQGDGDEFWQQRFRWGYSLFGYFFLFFTFIVVRLDYKVIFFFNFWCSLALGWNILLLVYFVARLCKCTCRGRTTACLCLSYS